MSKINWRGASINPIENIKRQVMEIASKGRVLREKQITKIYCMICEEEISTCVKSDCIMKGKKLK